MIQVALPKKVEQWIWTLLGGAISGGANAALASFGPGAFNAAAATVGVHVTVKGFEATQLLSMFISGALVGAFMFLAKSPVPFPLDDSQSVPVRNIAPVDSSPKTGI